MDFPIIILLQATQGFSFALFYLAAVEVLTKLVPFELRSSALSLLQSVGFGVGTIVGSVGGGWLLKQSGLFVLYLIMAGLSVLGVLKCFIGITRKSRDNKLDTIHEATREMVSSLDKT